MVAVAMAIAKTTATAITVKVIPKYALVMYLMTLNG